jgi:hypothetical protein
MPEQSHVVVVERYHGGPSDGAAETRTYRVAEPCDYDGRSGYLCEGISGVTTGEFMALAVDSLSSVDGVGVVVYDPTWSEQWKAYE